MGKNRSYKKNIIVKNGPDQWVEWRVKETDPVIKIKIFQRTKDHH